MPLFPFLLLLALTAPAGAREAPARPICPEDAPEGVRLAPQPGCRAHAPRTTTSEAAGFRDVGGVKLRVGGRVGAEYGLSR